MEIDNKLCVTLQIENEVSGEWEPCEEFEMEESTQDGANNIKDGIVTRWCTGVFVREGRFRIRFFFKEDFDWNDARAVKITLWFDEGESHRNKH